MANANIATIAVTNTFDEWRTRTNDLIVDRNILRNHPYVKDNSNFEIANGAVVISRAGGGTLLTVASNGDALIGGTTTTTDLIVGDDASVANQLTVGSSTGGRGNTLIYGNTSISKNTYISQNAYITGDIRVNTAQFLVYSETGNTVINGDLTVSGGDIIANTSQLNVFNTVVNTLYVANFANAITIGNTTSLVTLRGDLDVLGGDITSTATANVVNTSATEVNVSGAAALTRIGSDSGTVNVRNNLTVTNDLTVLGGDIISTATANVVDTSETTINFARRANSVVVGNTTSTTTVQGDLVVSGGDITSTATANLLNTTTTTLNLGGAATVVEIGAATGLTNINNNLEVDGDLTVDGGDIITATATANIANTTASTINFGRVANTVTIGNTTSTVTLQGDLVVSGGDITSTATANLLNTTTTTLNLGGAATTVEIGAASGTTNINNNLDVDGDVNIDGGDLTVSTSTFNLANTTATTVNFAGAATALNLGAATGTTDVKNNLNVVGDLDVDGGDITSTATANLLNTSPTAINFGRLANTVTIGNTTSTVTLQGDLVVSGGDITSTATANLFNATTTTLNIGGAATTVEIGAATGTTNINNNLDVDGDVNIDGGDLTVSTASFNLVNATATTVNLAGAATSLNMGAASGTTTIRNSATVTGDLTVSGGDILSTATANLLNSTTTTLNLGGAATTIEMGALTGTTNVRNNLNVTGDLDIDGGDLTVSTASFNLVNATATTINFGGGASAIAIGAATSNVTFNSNTVTSGNAAVTGRLTASNLLFSTTESYFLLNGDARIKNLTVTGIQTNEGNIVNDSDVFLLRANSSTDGDARLRIKRGTGTVGNAELRFLASGNKWQVSANANAVHYDIITTQGEQTIAGNVIIGQDLTVTGNLRVEGNVTSLNVQTLEIEDNDIVLNSNTTGSPALNASITVDRGTSTNTFLRWNEGVDKWGWSDNGTTFYSFDTALNAYGAANNASNATRVSANTGSTLNAVGLNFNNTATVNVSVGSGTSGNANITFTVNTTGSGITTAQSTAQNAYGQANAAYTAANNIASGATAITLKSYRDAIVVNNSVGAANTVNFNTSNWFQYTLTGSSGNRQFTFTNAPAAGTGFTVTMILIQDATGSKTPTWANTIYWAGGQVPPATTTANARDLWTFTTYDGGSTFLGTLAVKDAR